MNINYLPAEYCLDRGFHFLIPSRNDWDPNTVVHPDYLDVYTKGFKPDNGVGSDIYSGKLDSRLPDYCSVFQATVIAIYRAAQWILVNCVPFNHVSVFSDSQAAIRSMSSFLNNARMVRECRHCLDLISERFSVSLVCVPGHSNVLENCRADELARAGALLPESSSFELGIPKVMAIYRAAQWILVSGAPFNRISVFSDSQAAIRSLSGFVNNFRMVRKCRLCLDLLSGRFSI